MKPPEDYETHPDVGSISFQYVHPEPNGGYTRREFCIKAGDNPDFWLAERLMPGAEHTGVTAGVFVCDEQVYKSYMCQLLVGGSVFHTKLYADTSEELQSALLVIGGLQSAFSAKPLSRWKQIKLVFRWYWERRPQIRRRSPLWIFD